MIGFHHIKANSLEELEEKIDSFLLNPTINEVTDIKVQDYVSQNRVTGEMIMTHVGFLTFRYDKAMNDLIVDESQLNFKLEGE